jgi:hypothetical protein
MRLVYTYGESRPVVESIIASLLCRGAGRLTYKDHRDAPVHKGMAVMAHNAETLVRIHGIVCRSKGASSADGCAGVAIKSINAQCNTSLN